MPTKSWLGTTHCCPAQVSAPCPVPEVPSLRTGLGKNCDPSRNFHFHLLDMRMRKGEMSSPLKPRTQAEEDRCLRLPPQGPEVGFPRAPQHATPEHLSPRVGMLMGTHFRDHSAIHPKATQTNPNGSAHSFPEWEGIPSSNGYMVHHTSQWANPFSYNSGLLLFIGMEL